MAFLTVSAVVSGIGGVLSNVASGAIAVIKVVASIAFAGVFAIAITTLLSLDMIYPSGRKDTPGKPVEYSTTDNFLKRFKLKSLAELPDYNELMRRIAEMTAIPQTDSNYLYEKDVYDPTQDIDEADASGEGEGAQATDTSGFELPDFLEDIKDGLIKIE